MGSGEEDLSLKQLGLIAKKTTAKLGRVVGRLSLLIACVSLTVYGRERPVYASLDFLGLFRWMGNVLFFEESIWVTLRGVF